MLSTIVQLILSGIERHLSFTYIVLHASSILFSQNVSKRNYQRIEIAFFCHVDDLATTNQQHAIRSNNDVAYARNV